MKHLELGSVPQFVVSLSAFELLPGVEDWARIGGVGGKSLVRPRLGALDRIIERIEVGEVDG